MHFYFLLLLFYLVTIHVYCLHRLNPLVAFLLYIDHIYHLLHFYFYCFYFFIIIFYFFSLLSFHLPLLLPSNYSLFLCIAPYAQLNGSKELSRPQQNFPNSSQATTPTIFSSNTGWPSTQIKRSKAEAAQGTVFVRFGQEAL